MNKLVIEFEPLSMEEVEFAREWKEGCRQFTRADDIRWKIAFVITVIAFVVNIFLTSQIFCRSRSEWFWSDQSIFLQLIICGLAAAIVLFGVMFICGPLRKKRLTVAVAAMRKLQQDQCYAALVLRNTELKQINTDLMGVWQHLSGLQELPDVKDDFAYVDKFSS